MITVSFLEKANMYTGGYKITFRFYYYPFFQIMMSFKNWNVYFLTKYIYKNIQMPLIY